MSINKKHLAIIHNLVTDIIPLKVCKHYSVLPISIDNRIPRRVLFTMVDPENIIACDTLRKYVHRKNYKYQKSYITPEDYERLLNLYSEYLETLEQENKLKFCFKDIKYNNGNNQKIKPQPGDLVLGGEGRKIYKSHAILGGIEGIKYKLNNPSLPVKIQALHDCFKYPQHCCQILLQVIKNKKGLMVWVAYSLLHEINKPEIKNIIKEYQYRLKQESLEGVNLEQVNLKNINLVDSNLNFANFRGAIINETTHLNPKFLLYWQIVNQGLSDADLSKFTFQKAFLNSSNLSNINFRKSHFLLVDFSSCNLEKVDFLGSKIFKTKLDFSKLIYVDLRNTMLNQINLANSYLDKVSLSQAKLLAINFRNSNLNNIDFHGSALEKIDFQKAHLTNINFKNSSLKQINFTKAILHNVDMSYLDLSKSKIRFKNLDLTNSKFIKTNLQGLDFSNANLSNVNLTGANLSNANLTGANLSNAKLTSVIFNEETIFPKNFDRKKLIQLKNNL